MRIALCLLGATILAAGCGDDSSQAGSEFSFNMTHLACPSESLVITDSHGRFPDDSMVTFTMGNTMVDGDGVVLANGTIDCGLPAGSAPGTYHVTVTEPGMSPYPVGDVTLDATDCPP